MRKTCRIVKVRYSDGSLNHLIVPLVLNIDKSIDDAFTMKHVEQHFKEVDHGGKPVVLASRLGSILDTEEAEEEEKEDDKDKINP